MRYSLVLTLLSVILITDSCVSRKKLTYLQFSDKSSESEYLDAKRTSVTPAAYKVMPYDNLYIRVITPDPQWSALFNATPSGQGGTVTEESASLLGYTVDLDGNIEIPYVGKVEVEGKTLSEIKSELDETFKDYVTDASITVRLVNNYVTLLGEVRAPGRHQLSKDRINVLEAISMAGDLNEFSNRQKVQLIRPSPYGPIIKEFSLTDRRILTSEYFYIMPNDIIYVKPMAGKTFQANASVYSLLFSTITTALVIVQFFRIGN